MRALLVEDFQKFERNTNPLDSLKIGTNAIAEKILLDIKELDFPVANPSAWNYIDEEILVQIILFLLKNDYNEDIIKRLLGSEHMRWMYTDWRFDINDFKKYLNSNTNSIKEFISGKTEKGSKMYIAPWKKVIKKP
jgi:hypothetical protein